MTELEEFEKWCGEIFKGTKAPSEQMKCLVIKDDIAMRKLVSVWAAMPHGKNRDSLNAISLSQWCALAGLPDSEMNLNKCENLLNLNIVLPDGRVHYWVQNFLFVELEGGKE
jgi:hypothetical protein